MGNGLAIYNDTDFCITCEASMLMIHQSENHIEPGQIFYHNSGAVWKTLTAYPTTSTTSVSGFRRARRNQARMKLIMNIAQQFATATVSVSDSISKVTVGAADVCDNVAPTIFDTEVPQGIATSISNSKERMKPIFGKDIKPKEVKMLLDTSLGLKLKTEDAKATHDDEIAIRYLLGQLEKSDLYASETGCYGGWNGTWLKLTGGPKYDSKDKSWKAGDFQFVEMKRGEIIKLGKFTPDSQKRYDAHNSSQHHRTSSSQYVNQIDDEYPLLQSDD